MSSEELLKEPRWAPKSDACRSIHAAVSAGDLAAVEGAFDPSLDLDVIFSSPDPDEEPFQEGSLLLHLAAENGHTAIVKYLLDKGASVDIRGCLDCDGESTTPLHLAAGNCHIETVRTLLKYRPDISAIGYGRRSVICEVLQGVRHDVVENEGSPPTKNFRYPILPKHIDLINLLLDHGASLDANPDYGSLVS
jgi:ankyrin repeat protein